MKLKNFFTDIFKKIQVGISRFLSSFIITFIIFVILSAVILYDIDTEWITKGCVSLTMGLVFSIFFTVCAERLKLNKILTQLLPIIPTALCYILIEMEIIEDYFWMGYFGIIFALGCFTLCLLYNDSNKDQLIPHIIKNIFFSYLVCILLTGGIFLCLWAIETLIFSFDSDIYLVVILFIWIVIFANTFLAYIPKRDEELSLPKLLNTIIVKITLPVYLFLITILYIYLIKIVVTRNMPIGQINWFASYASLFFVFFAFCVKPYEDKLSKVFSKFSGYVIIPIVIMQLIAIYERVSAYGLTTPRIISLILIGISIIFAVVSILNKKMHKVWWAVGIIILVFTLIPKVNIIDMPKASQINLIEKYLVKNNMLVDNKIVPNENVEDYDRERIISAYDYLMDSAGKLPVWLEDNRHTAQIEVLGFGSNYYTIKDNIYRNYSNEYDYIDVSQYKSMINYDEYIDPDESQLLTININNNIYEYDAKKLFKQLYDKYGESNDNIEPVELSENLVLYITYSNFSYNEEDDILDSLSIHGYIFEK